MGEVSLRPAAATDVAALAALYANAARVMGPGCYSPEQVAAWARFGQDSPAFRAYVERQVEEINQGLARYETIKKIALLPKELSVETGELTPTLKLKRRVILERHRETIQALYA